MIPACRTYNRVFGIGLSKTGTKSLCEALNILGLSAWHHPKKLLKRGQDGKLALKGQGFVPDAMTDSIVALFYKELDVRYPKSKFILTVRSTEEWLLSCERHFGYSKSTSAKLNALRWKLYGCEHYDGKLFKDAYNRHVDDVLGYFSKRKSDLLILDICGGVEWKPLCQFLRLNVPNVSFPWKNKADKSN
jgi:hypothetical protein